MSRNIEPLLQEWGCFHIKHMHHADEYGSNILYQAGIMGGRVQDPGDGHRILCPDMPRHLQAIDIALKRLPPLDALVIKIFYCCPQKEDGSRYSKAELAVKVRMSTSGFDHYLKKSKKRLKKQL